MNRLREYLAGRSVIVNRHMMSWAAFAAFAVLARWVILWLYPGWWMASPPLFVAALFGAFRAGRGAGWRDCWQEILRYLIRVTSMKERP